MKVNKETHLITDFEGIDKHHLYKQIVHLMDTPDLFKEDGFNKDLKVLFGEWADMCGIALTDNNYLFTLLSAFPYRVLRSLIESGYSYSVETELESEDYR